MGNSHASGMAASWEALKLELVTANWHSFRSTQSLAFSELSEL
jgi:hypothetical protein